MKPSSLRLLILSLLLLFSGLQCEFVTSFFEPSTPQEQPIQPPLDQDAQAPQLDQPIQPLPDQPDQPLPDNPLPQDLPAQPGEFQLTGIWESQVQTEYGMVYSELILEPTGTFSQQVVFGELMTYDVGTYAVGEGFIHFVVEKHEPQEYKGEQMTWVGSFTYFFTPLDANSMLLEDHIAGTSWTMYRR